MENDLYDVSKYTDQQLYDILDINNPTDRELEARIVYLVNKYSEMQNESGYKLAVFFQNIYSRFFDLDTDIVEGLGPLQISNDFIDQSGNTQKKIEDAINQNTKYNNSEDIQSTFTLDYTKDKFGLNPLLKQTIKRIICIDSQYRDNKNTTLSTELTFNLSEPLRDVVSLKLESIQIPLTWYTISKSFGSNFFYLKGISDGINNGKNDYKIEISPGYYTMESTKENQKNIFEAINNSIIDVSNEYSYVNFGDTKIVSTNGKSTITVEIENIYNESNYMFDFINNYNTNNSLTKNFGFINQTVYEPYAIYSNQKTELTSILINNRDFFQVDNSNNYFDIVHYSPDVIEGLAEEYTSNSIILNTIRIQLTKKEYYRNDLIIDISNQIKSNIFLSTKSEIKQIDITDPSNIYFGYSHYKIKIILDRYKIKPVQNSKVIIIFPDESKLNRNTVWTKKSNTTSALFFDSSYNETNTIYGETISIPSSIQINNNTNIFLKCINPPNYTSTSDFSQNDYKIPIYQGNYNITNFINIVNKSFTDNSYNGIIKGTASLLDSKFKLNVDIIKNFTNDKWKINIEENSALYIYLGFSDTSKESNSSYVFNGTFKNRLETNQNYIIDTSFILNFLPSENDSSKIYESFNVCTENFFNQKIYSNYLLLLADIEKNIKQFKIENTECNETQYPLSKSFIESRKRIDSSNVEWIDVSLNIFIDYYLTENNYEIQFNDPKTNNNMNNLSNSWNKIKIHYSYILFNKKLQQDASAESQNYSTIISNSNISLSEITMDSTNNKFQIVIDPSSDIYTPSNNILITIPENKYTKYELISYINTKFNDDPTTKGSKFEIYVKNDFEYVKIRMNINKIYTTIDYKLVFYDPFSFIKCFVGAKSVKNTTWDSTLGWILGFRDYTEYELNITNATANNGITYYRESIKSIYIESGNGGIELTGDTNCTLTTNKYFYIILNDYIQNHINDGLVSMSKKETDIQINSSQYTIKTCDPTTNTTTITTTTNTDGLTSKQLYALNQSLISKRNTVNNFSNNTNISDIFAMIPLKIGGIPNGSYYIETGGNLQNQERLYFGPVNIHRMSIKLVNNNGDVVDLNDVDWSFSFICEQLYRT